VHGHAAGAIEWEDDMVEVNKATPANTRWQLVDRDTAAAGDDINWRFTVGDQVKVRLVNEMESDHPMHHPFHIHGAGRFLVLARGGVVEPNLVWTRHRPDYPGPGARPTARGNAPGDLDGPLPYRGAPRKRDDVPF
jgi:FtsP/CotA-like multicopper oxidase with cupredoxin domain